MLSKGGVLKAMIPTHRQHGAAQRTPGDDQRHGERESGGAAGSAAPVSAGDGGNAGAGGHLLAALDGSQGYPHTHERDVFERRL